MSPLVINEDPRVEPRFQAYPAHIQPKMAYLRQLVKEVAAEIDNLGTLEETLKWGEPSYLAKKGSTIRMDWKTKKPDQYAMYFKCTSKLVVTFKEIFGDTFNYETTRALVFGLEEELPVAELKACIKMALLYHNVKHLPSLGYGLE